MRTESLSVARVKPIKAPAIQEVKGEPDMKAAEGILRLSLKS